MSACEDWGSDQDGCPLLMSGDSCTYLPVSLPVVWEMFEVQRMESAALLEWVTGTEINNDRFEIEWSQDALRFEMIESIPGVGNSSSAQKYSFLHTEPLHGDNYYRLKQIDLNGAYAYSGIRHIYIEKFDEPVIAPNRSSDIIRLLGLSSFADLHIFNSQGDLVFTGKGLADGSAIDISSLASGYYMARINYGSKLKILPVIKI